jgi:hypothetical protein
MIVHNELARIALDWRRPAGRAPAGGAVA